MPWAKHALEGRDMVRRAFDAAYRIGIEQSFFRYSKGSPEIVTEDKELQYAYKYKCHVTSDTNNKYHMKW